MNDQTEQDGEPRAVRQDRRLIVGVFVMAMLALLPGVFWGLPFGKFIVGARVILESGDPYRDFWTMYAPGSFYLVAGLFALFGPHVLVQGLGVVVLRALSAAAFFVLARRVGESRATALVVTGVFVLMFWETSAELTSYEPALLLLLLAVNRMLHYFGRGQGRPLLHAGLLCGVAAWFKHDVAAYGAAACGASLIVAWFAVSARRPSAWHSPMRACGLLAAGSLAAILPIAIFIAWTGGWAAWEDLFVFPATVFSKAFGDPYPSVLPSFAGSFIEWFRDPLSLGRAHAALTMFSAWILANVPQYAFVAGVLIVTVCRRRIEVRTLAPAILFLAFLPPFWLAAHVQQNTHVYTMATFSMLLGIILWRSVSPVALCGRPVRLAIGLGGAAYASGLLIPPSIDVVYAASRLPHARTLDAPGVRGVLISAEEHAIYQPIADLVEVRVPPQEAIYVGVARHDAIVATNMRFYYLLGRPGCSRYYELQAGVVDHEIAQRDIAGAINEHAVRCVILWRFGWPDAMLDAINARRVAAVPGLGATLLDKFLASEFEPIEEFGEYVVLWRRADPAESPSGINNASQGPPDE